MKRTMRWLALAMVATVGGCDMATTMVAVDGGGDATHAVTDGGVTDGGDPVCSAVCVLMHTDAGVGWCNCFDDGGANAVCHDCGYQGGPCCNATFCPQGGRALCDGQLRCNDTAVCD